MTFETRAFRISLSSSFLLSIRPEDSRELIAKGATRDSRRVLTLERNGAQLRSSGIFRANMPVSQISVYYEGNCVFLIKIPVPGYRYTGTGTARTGVSLAKEGSKAALRPRGQRWQTRRPPSASAARAWPSLVHSAGLRTAAPSLEKSRKIRDEHLAI